MYVSNTSGWKTLKQINKHVIYYVVQTKATTKGYHITVYRTYMHPPAHTTLTSVPGFKF